jgi:putative transposase
MKPTPLPIRSKVHRFNIQNATYFITTNTQNRKPLFANEQNVVLLRSTMREVKKHHPFQMRAYAFMPDHLHLLLLLLATTEITKLMQSIKRNFTRNFKAERGLNGSLKLWQRSFHDHVIRDERDYLNHLHYIHYNPVKHGYVTRPQEYPHTSFMEYVRLGWYDLDEDDRDHPEWMNLYKEL